MKQMRKPTWALIAVIVGSLLLCGVVAAAATIRVVNGPSQTEWVETEDCDAEDWRNYDPECHRVSPKPKASTIKASTPAAKKTPAPRRTR